MDALRLSTLRDFSLAPLGERARVGGCLGTEKRSSLNVIHLERVHFDDKSQFNEHTLKMRPSEYFERQCWISFEPVETSLAYAAERLGPHKILWATDYPHP